MNIFSWIRKFFNPDIKEPVKIKKKFITDHEYNTNRKRNQDKIDKILDKISINGYESLTEQEKQFLIDRSKD